MDNGFFLYRWFKNVSIAHKLYFTVGTMALLIGIELFVLFFSLSILSSLRAYVGGEGLWSKAQKDAVFHLYRYGVSHTEADYNQFEQFMQVPIGDAEARQALLDRDQNLAAVREGFLRGRNHPDDIAGMASLIIHFGNFYYLEKATTIWGDAQAIAMQLLPIAAQLHAEINSPTPSESKIAESLAAIYVINERITALEDEFSFTLGEGSRWLEHVVLKLLLATALTVETTGLLLALSVSRGIQKGLSDIIRAARFVASGQLSTRANVLAHDEIGQVASSFNDMADNLERRVRELAQLNRHLTHAIADRERAEAESRQALGRLADTIQKLECEMAERRRTEEMLRQSAKMKALGQLTGGIAHDFNNLLGVIIGSVELLREAMDDTPEYTALTGEILDSAQRGSRLTRRLLAVGRKQFLQPERVDLNALLVAHADMLRRVLGPMIDVKVTRTQNLWSTIADPSQIEDALLNLALNARDAMPQGGRLTLEAANLRLDRQDAGDTLELAEGDYVMLSVADTGMGMSQAVLERAMEPFFTTKPASSGSGLGLSMAYGLAKQSGGDLAIESEVGVGTTVRLYLPRNGGETTSVPIPHDNTVQPARGTESVLIVDDNVNLLAIARRHLTALGYHVLSAASGPAALDILGGAEVVDLLFTDIVMPDGMSGYELAEAALRLRPDLKLLFTTGYTAELSELDAHHILRKPYSRRHLAQAVRYALDGLATMPA